MKKLKKYPVIIFFGLLLYLISIADLFSPQYEFSELENRDLAEFPKFDIKSLIENEYTPKIEDFTEDHFIVRDTWISLKSISESLLGKNENNGVVYGKDGYLFTKMLSTDLSQREKNINALQTFIQNYSEISNIKVMIVPTAPSVLTDFVPQGAPVNNISDVLSQLSQKVDSKYILDVTDTLKSKTDEYIYYRTDHHWTTLGAYYAYSDYMNSIGRTPQSLDSFNFVQVEDFLGTHYSKSKNYDVVPDTLSYVENDSQIEIDGSVYPIYNYEKLQIRDKYAMFLQGNNAFVSVKGNGEGKILIIKDSYANCLVPYMTNDFAQIDVLDMRYYKSSVPKLIEENQYDEILILYNSETFDTDIYIPRINLSF